MRELDDAMPATAAAVAGLVLLHWRRVAVEGRCGALAPSFHRKLGAVLRKLRELSRGRWQLCYLGYHEPSGELLPRGVNKALGARHLDAARASRGSCECIPA